MNSWQCKETGENAGGHNGKKKRRIERKILGFSMLLMLVMPACRKEEKRPTVAPPVKVTVEEVGAGTTGMTREYSGTVASSQTTTVSFSVGGTITELKAKEGQKVAKGQLLGKIRNGEYQNAYNIAQAQLAEARDGYERLKKLHDANALAEVKWVEMEQKLKQAENAAQIARRTLDDANLYSPASGTITEKYADVGQTVLPAQPVYQIVSTSNIEIDIAVPENEIGDFIVGQTAKVEMTSAELGQFEGKVVQKSVMADPLTRAYTVKISIPSFEGKILPGMIGKVVFDRVAVDSMERSISLPSQAVLLNHDNRWFVWVVNDSVAERRFVTAEQLTANGVLVTSGLNPGDKVIVEGMQKVGTGTRVVPVSK